MNLLHSYTVISKSLTIFDSDLNPFRITAIDLDRSTLLSIVMRYFICYYYVQNVSGHRSQPVLEEAKRGASTQYGSR